MTISMDGQPITPVRLNEFSNREVIQEFAERISEQGTPLQNVMCEVEAAIICGRLRANGWNQCKTARDLGIHRNTLSRKISELKITINKDERRDRKRKTPAHCAPAPVV